MSRVFNYALVTLFCALLFSGCSDTGPTPEDTVLGKPKTLNVPGDVVGEGTGYVGIGPNNGGGFNGGDLDTPEMRDESMFGGGLGGNGAGQNVMDSVYFGFDQSSIPPAERSKVDSAAAYLRNNPSARLIAEGHTDAIGTAEYNNALSDRRANSVKLYLEQAGISGDRVEILALGETVSDQSATKGSDAAARDRRVDLIPVE